MKIIRLSIRKQEQNTSKSNINRITCERADTKENNARSLNVANSTLQLTNTIKSH